MYSHLSEATLLGSMTNSAPSTGNVSLPPHSNAFKPHRHPETYTDPSDCSGERQKSRLRRGRKGGKEEGLSLSQQRWGDLHDTLTKNKRRRGMAIPQTFQKEKKSKAKKKNEGPSRQKTDEEPSLKDKKQNETPWRVFVVGRFRECPDSVKEDHSLQ